MSGNAVKVALRGPHGDIETLWANRAEAPDQYILDNVPWYAYGVSVGDTIEARPDDTGYLQMLRVVAKCGNRTIRVMLDLTILERIGRSNHVKRWTV